MRRNRESRFDEAADWRGFTLVELLVVVSIISLLMGILMPVLGKHWGEANTPVLFDFGHFHNKAGQPGAINFLFGDGHVGDLRI